MKELVKSQTDKGYWKFSSGEWGVERTNSWTKTN